MAGDVTSRWGQVIASDVIVILSEASNNYVEVNMTAEETKQASIVTHVGIKSMAGDVTSR